MTLALRRGIIDEKPGKEQIQVRNVNRDSVEMPGILQDSSIDNAMRSLRVHYGLPEDRRSTRRAPLQPALWQDQEVQLRLRELFLSKCAYCESRLPIKQTDVVTHHRPTSNAAGGSTRPSPDHYGWFAYEWKNMLAACLQCSRLKGNQFPIERSRVEPFMSFASADAIERPKLIDPSRDPARKHLTFLRDGMCVATSPRGQTTIDILALNRQDLLKERRASFDAVLASLRIRPTQSLQAFDSLLENFFEEKEEFVGAISLWICDALNNPNSRRRRETVAASQVRKQLWELSQRGDKPWIDLLHRLEAASLISNVDIELNERTATRSERAARVESIDIQNFKGIDKLSVRFDEAQSNPHGWVKSAALLGENATGKSSILQALCLVLMGPAPRRQLAIDPRQFMRSPQDADSEHLSDWRPDMDTVVKVRMDTGAVNMIRIDHRGVLHQDAGPGPMLLAYGAHRFFGAEDSAPGSIRKVSSLRSLFQRNREIPHSARWLSSIDQEDFHAIARALREVLSLGPADEIAREASGGILVVAHGKQLSLARMSDGYRSFMAMVLDIFRRMILEWGHLEGAHGVVLIDEVEIHLHPIWKMRVMSALRQAMPNVQFIFTTHDPLCLRGMYDGEVHVLVRNDTGQIEELTGLPDVRAMRAEQLLTSEFFGLASTADPEIFQQLDELALRGASGPTSNSLGDVRFSQQMRAFDMIGDTPAHQVVNEALRRRILEQLNSKRLDRAQVREDAIGEILQRLRAEDGEQGI